jgi:hypothetical protein
VPAVFSETKREEVMNLNLDTIWKGKEMRHEESHARFESKIDYLNADLESERSVKVAVG